MPISREQFDMGIDEKTTQWVGKIGGFLQFRHDEAFNEEELLEHFSDELIENLSRIDKQLVQQRKKPYVFDILPDEKSAFYAALDKCVEMKSIEKRKIRETYYYSSIERD
ncbi:MAG: hypothetical protein ACYDG5_09015 [Dehalococcoidales bacterium]